DAAEDRSVADDTVNRQAVILAEFGGEEVQQGLTLAVAAGGNLSIRNGAAGPKDWAADAARCSERHAEILAVEIFHNSFASHEEKELVLEDGPAKRAAKLVAAEAIERGAIGSRRSQGFGAEVFEGAAVKLVGPGFGDDVDDAARGAPVFGVSSAGDDLELFYRFQRD